MLGLVPWQWLLDGVGWALAELYRFIPQYGVDLILLTVLIRLVLFPLGIKQIRNMYAMQAIQPKMKTLQQRYKNDRQKLNEEMMKLYQEHGVNPLGGCLPMLIQMPVFIAMFSVLHFPAYGRYTPNHLPYQSALRVETNAATGAKDLTPHTSKVVNPSGAIPTMSFLGANLLCSLKEAGTNPFTVTDTVKVKGTATINTVGYMNCGKGVASRIPYVVLMLLMVASTYYQSWQMQKGSGSPATQQQKMMTYLLPAMMLFWGFLFPAGLVLYWTISNVWQIAQQHFIGASVREHMGEIVAKENPRGSTGPRDGQKGGGQKGGGQKGGGQKGGGQKGGQQRGAKPAEKGGQQRGAKPAEKGGQQRGAKPAEKGQPPRRNQPPRGSKVPNGDVPKKGFMSAWLEKAEAERQRRENQQRKSGGNGGRDREDRG